jgi:hypothetical protein
MAIQQVTAQYRMIEFTGTITGNQTVTTTGVNVEIFTFLKMQQQAHSQYNLNSSIGFWATVYFGHQQIKVGKYYMQMLTMVLNYRYL